MQSIPAFVEPDTRVYAEIRSSRVGYAGSYVRTSFSSAVMDTPLSSVPSEASVLGVNPSGVKLDPERFILRGSLCQN